MRAKMKCSSITQQNWSGEAGKVDAETVKLTAVYGKAGTANAAWSKATPSGEVELLITNPDTFGSVKIGQEYFVDFTEAPPEA